MKKFKLSLKLFLPMIVIVSTLVIASATTEIALSNDPTGAYPDNDPTGAYPDNDPTGAYPDNDPTGAYPDAWGDLDGAIPELAVMNMLEDF